MNWIKQAQFKQNPYKLLAASVLGIGFMPASGTWGSLVALLLAPLLMFFPGLTALVVILSFIAGICVIPALIKNQPNKDPSYIVIDEFMGQLSVLVLLPYDFINPITYIFAFLFFRLFDILKPWPVSFWDQKVHNAWGIMLDDLMAGIYSFCALALMHFITLY